MRIYLNFLTLIAAFSFDADCAPNENVTIEDRIVNGVDVTMTDQADKLILTYQVSIRFRPDDIVSYGKGHYCGGVLIKKDVVLTAANCMVNVRESLLEVWMGHIDILKNAQETGIFTSLVNEIIRHQDFERNQLMNNIAILKLQTSYPRSIQITMSVKPLDEVKDDCIISGWGRTAKEGRTVQKLKRGVVNIEPGTICVAKTQSEIPPGIICSRFLKNQKSVPGDKIVTPDFCHEDVGGPVVCTEFGTTVLYGLMHNSFCGEFNQFDAWYTDVGYYYNSFIQPNLGGFLEANGVFSNLKNSFQLTCFALIILNFLNVI